MIRFDHIGIPARNALASARSLADILGAGEPIADGADGDMFRIDLEHGFVLFATAPEVAPHHIAFAVDPARFADVVARLGALAVPFGNDPEDPHNGLTSDPLGGSGRVYFVDRDGHLFEVHC
jgi:catechol 2,3-dioxygenase-like lactoylglutathione lyase family enzyme